MDVFWFTAEMVFFGPIILFELMLLFMLVTGRLDS